MKVKKVKIFLVDDDPMAIRHFQNMLNENNEFYELIGSAKNGAKALSQIRLLKPDFVISDVQMPVMDGLELAEKIKNENPLIKIVLLTAYKEFSYAQKGIDIGIYAYLVKSEVKKEQIEELIWKVYEEIRVETEQRRCYLEKNMKEFLMNTEALSEQNMGYEEYHFLLLDIVAKQSVCLADINENQIRFPVAYLEEELKTEDIFCKMALQMTNNTCLVLLFIKKGMYEQACHYQTNKIFNIIQSIMKEEATDVVLLISELMKRYDQLPAAFRKLRKHVSHIYVDRPFRRLYVNQSMMPERNYLLFAQMKDKIFQNGQTEKGIMKRLFAVGRKNCSLTQYVQELNILSEQMIRWGEELNLPEIQRWEKERFQTFPTIEAAEDWISAIYDVCLKVQEEKDEILYSETVSRFMNLVEQEYGRQLTSEDICIRLDISKSHFRRIFKKEVGLKPMEYLNKYRIEVAKQLLLEKKYRISDIYEKVGFTSGQYFSVVFKKFTGVTPWQYQQKKGLSQNEKDDSF